ncbi:MAG: hypothetical protein LC768_03545 [Acidobacteria bacterium]|nr:hypothetical protein [Acidobacteriota bacterium]MCA1637401.1 hypothetical protein [Acidobacteriota bacterium]
MKTIKIFISTVFVFWVISLGNQVKAQAQATSVDQTNRDGTQCSSAGVGYGKDKQEAQMNADKNREKAESKARRKGNTSFSNKTGGGTAICINYNQQSTTNSTLINKNAFAESINVYKEKAENSKHRRKDDNRR